jgi:hypothetical protein
MPSQLEPALEERFAEVLHQLRQGHVEPSAELRQRVRMTARVEPAARRRLLNPRLALVLAGTALFVAGVAGAVRLAGGEQTAGEQAAQTAVQRGAPATTRAGQADQSAELAPTLQGRLQDFRAELTVRVEDADKLPAATQQAMRIAQTAGGYVVSASYSGGESDSLLVLRVPIARAQEAIGRLSSLGELAGQRYSLQDLQSTVDQLDAQADRLQVRIAELGRQLRSARLTVGERVALRNRLEQAQRELEDVLAQRDGTAAQGRSAEITVTLTAARGEPASQGVIDRAVDALARVWAWVLAVLIVGLPFAVLLAAAVLVGRRLRRRANERLLGS